MKVSRFMLSAAAAGALLGALAGCTMHMHLWGKYYDDKTQSGGFEVTPDGAIDNGDSALEQRQKKPDRQPDSQPAWHVLEFGRPD